MTMRHVTRFRFIAGLAAALLGGATRVDSVDAQMLPVVPYVPPAVRGCVLAGDLGPCFTAVTPVTPVSVFPGMGSRHVDVDKHVEHSREQGGVVVR
jgi:hypothetical protein